MTTEQRILALDAAACACEGLTPLPPNLRAAVSLLQDELDAYFGAQEPKCPDFDQFLDDQRDAVTALANNPQVFGA